LGFLPPCYLLVLGFLPPALVAGLEIFLPPALVAGPGISCRPR
jgi:hypothetical protein